LLGASDEAAHPTSGGVGVRSPTSGPTSRHESRPQGAFDEHQSCQHDRANGSIRSPARLRPARRAGVAATDGDFASVIQKSLSAVNTTQAQAKPPHQYQLGQGTFRLEDAMISMQKANISFRRRCRCASRLVSALYRHS